MAVGSGISKPEHVKAIIYSADGAIVGSAFVNIIHKNQGDISGMPKESEKMHINRKKPLKSCANVLNKG